mmetsp:Transcript_293/g.536  ORF Transcript_293/g.536 Transcript_293/m.536 type:complete len:310 (-) Transcript_293:11-940(-)
MDGQARLGGCRTPKDAGADETTGGEWHGRCREAEIGRRTGGHRAGGHPGPGTTPERPHRNGTGNGRPKGPSPQGHCLAEAGLGGRTRHEATGIRARIGGAAGCIRLGVQPTQRTADCGLEEPKGGMEEKAGGRDQSHRGGAESTARGHRKRHFGAKTGIRGTKEPRARGTRVGDRAATGRTRGGTPGGIRAATRPTRTRIEAGDLAAERPLHERSRRGNCGKENPKRNRPRKGVGNAADRETRAARTRNEPKKGETERGRRCGEDEIRRSVKPRARSLRSRPCSAAQRGSPRTGGGSRPIAKRSRDASH